MPCRLQHAAWIIVFLAGTMVAAEPDTSWSKSAVDVNPDQLYDAESPANLENCDVSVWQTRPPKVQFTMDFLVMDRDTGSSSPLLVDSVTGQVLLNTGDIIQDPEPGLRLGMILLDDTGPDVEFNYLGLDTFGGTVTRTSQNPILFPFFGGVPGNPRRTYSVQYRSEINSAEINLRNEIGPRVSWLAGIRFMELRERFNINSSSGGFFSHTDNDLYGVQVGGDVQLFRVCQSLFFSTLKAGVYYNNADVAASAATNRGNAIGFIDDEDVAAFSGDVAVGMLIPMGPSADLRIGYQGLYLDGVGLAPDQSASYSLFTSSGTLDEATVFYHGGFIGLDLFW